MTRKTLNESKIHANIAHLIGGTAEYQNTIDEIIAAISANNIVVVGMQQNPFPKKARKLLDEQGLSYHYLEYGSYFKEWKRRGAIKMWAGWQTFPMIFIRGVLIGGYSDLQKLVDNNLLQALLDEGR